MNFISYSHISLFDQLIIITVLSRKPLISASMYELIHAFEIPVSEFYKILGEISEPAMMNNSQLYSRKRIKVLNNIWE